MSKDMGSLKVWKRVVRYFVSGVKIDLENVDREMNEVEMYVYGILELFEALMESEISPVAYFTCDRIMLSDGVAQESPTYILFTKRHFIIAFFWQKYVYLFKMGYAADLHIAVRKFVLFIHRFMDNLGRDDFVEIMHYIEKKFPKLFKLVEKWYEESLCSILAGEGSEL